MESFIYTNNWGFKKRLEIDTAHPKDGKYFSTIWNLNTGDLCSSGYNTPQELMQFLRQYGIIAKL